MTESYEVTVALVGRPDDPQAIDEDCGRAYRDRPKVTLNVSPKDSLNTVLNNATALFEKSIPGDYSAAGYSIAFYSGDPEEGVTLTIPSVKNVTLTDAKGLAVWNVSPEDASIEQLVVAHQRNVFQGDPLRPYLVVDPMWGMAGPTPGGWGNFIYIWRVLEALGTLYFVHEVSQPVLKRVNDSWSRHRAAAEYCRKAFEDRGADIMDVIGTTRAADAHRIADFMAWTGITDAAYAADVAGFAGYQLEENAGVLSLDPDEDYLGLVRDLPIDLSLDLLGDTGNEADKEVERALKEALLTLGLTSEDDPAS